jgi:ubiquinone biosynthesis protein COQ4
MMNTKQEELLLSSFLDMVNTTDGDFTVLAQLAKASSDQESMQLMIQHLSLHPEGKQAFANHFSLGLIDLTILSKLADHTLGYLYAKHMMQNQLKPLQAEPPKDDQGFLGMHITETHDIWHVVTGSKTDMLGEIQLEAFYVAQLKMSRFWLALLTKNLLKSLVYNIEVADQYMTVANKGWTMGNKAKPLFGVDWNTLWEMPIEQVRASFNIVDV